MRKRGRTRCGGLGTRGAASPLWRGDRCHCWLLSLASLLPKKPRNGVKWWDLAASSKAACREGSERR